MNPEVKAPLVSIVIPTYNHGHVLGRALQSVLIQSYTNWEAIVVDNHSTDNTDEVLAGFTDPRIRVLKIHNHGVIAASRNMGNREAKGAWVAFLDSDDWWDEDKLTQSMRFTDRADVVYHDLRLVTKDGQRVFYRCAQSRRLRKDAFRDLIANGNALINSSVLVRKKLIDGVDGLSEDSEKVAWEDYDLWLRFAETGARFVKIPGKYGYYWSGGGNVSSPKRTIMTLHFFLQQYALDEAVPWWVCRALAVAQASLGDRLRSRQYFLQALTSLPPVGAFIKIVLRWSFLEVRSIVWGSK